MESQDFNKELIDYLYGEMNSSEKKEFEKRLESDPELRRELEELQGVRDELASLKDKEVMEPFSIWDMKQDSWFGAPRRRSIILNPIAAIAASLVILMVVGYVTNFSVSINDDGFQMGFNKVEEINEQPSLNEADVKRILAQEIDKNNDKILTSIDTTKSAFDSRFVSLENKLKNAESKATQVISREDLDQFFVQVQNQNAEVLQEYLNQSSTQQQEYFKTMLTQFNDYLQEQRAEDLNYVQTEMLELKYSQTQQKVETDQVLAGIINTVSKRQN